MCVEFHSDIINQLKGFEAVAEIKEGMWAMNVSYKYTMLCASYK